ncbi:glycosyltransferase family 2 protein [Halobacillus sp. Marseille-Q1614]|uniref:glycosyltransferase n=1 Tax=Halobacillus sp. Marseille-Q1614 TaxID=2709134 RepID=UPI001570EB63|nr:glycosyltransferase family 2 protein [Halobacillus sp. Marseille-Q1614]
MWFMLTAVAVTLFLFWHRVSFPNVKHTSTRTYTIIIPARNEEENLKKLLSSLTPNDDKQREIIVVDDDSDDQTYATAAQHGVRVINNPPLPEGWMGKSWACYTGAKEASGEVLMFLDADTWFSPSGPTKLIQYLETKGRDALITVHPYHYMYSFWEKLSSVFHLVVFASSGITTIFKGKMGARGGFGPCLVIDADTYWKLGGHKAIRREIVEHLSMARRAQSKGIKTYAFSGKNVVNMRMYPASLKAVINGWSKSFASGAKSASPLMTAANIVWITTIVSFLTNISKAGWWSLAGYLAIVLWLYRILKDIGNFKWYDAFLLPLHFAFFVFLFAYSILRTFLFKQSTWKGRNITKAGKRG